MHHPEGCQLVGWRGVVTWEEDETLPDPLLGIISNAWLATPPTLLRCGVADDNFSPFRPKRATLPDLFLLRFCLLFVRLAFFYAARDFQLLVTCKRLYECLS